mmetsp:Transcript_57392/g.151134  ORF Transcript_57392/g.151134 Transcript_57392/m.151134 type:complete len:214 (+) Transcript_57392:153-794(+)
MKPTCDVGSTVLPRAHSGDTGSPSACSRSPCAKNSESTASAQRLARGKGRDGLERSAVCSRLAQNWSRAVWSACHLSASDPRLATRPLSSCVCLKWSFMSVASVTWITIRRASRAWSAGRAAKRSTAGFSAMWRNTVARWKFSWMERSLKARARSVLAFSWKALLSPSWPASWSMAAMSSEKRVSRSRKASAPQRRMMWCTACSTSAAWTEAW